MDLKMRTWLEVADNPKSEFSGDTNHNKVEEHSEVLTRRRESIRDRICFPREETALMNATQVHKRWNG